MTGTEPDRGRTSRSAALLVLAVALLARLPALAPAPTPDAVEYRLLARSLARGEGFTLPLKVRHDAPGPTRHDACGERAPLFPLFLAALERLGLARAESGGDTRAIPVAFQLANALVGALAAILALSLARALASARPLGQEAPGSASPSLAPLLAGLLVALAPPLAVSSSRLYAEPLALVLLLGAARLEASERGGLPRSLAAGALLALARLARPESVVAALVLGVARLVPLGRRAEDGRPPSARPEDCRPRSARPEDARTPDDRRRAAALALGFGGATALATGLGFGGAPQTFLLRVGHFSDVMFGWGSAPPPAASPLAFASEHPGLVLRLVATNLADLALHAVRTTGALPLLGLAALVLVCRGPRPGEPARAPGETCARHALAALALAGIALALATALVWATRDHTRFLVGPLGLVAVPAAFAAERLARRGRGAALVLAVALVLPPLVEGTRTLARLARPRPQPVWSGAGLDALGRRLEAGLSRTSAFAAVSPWGLSLASGRDALLLPVHLDRAALEALLADHPEVRAVVLRPEAPHDDLIPEPVAYEPWLVERGARLEVIAAAASGEATALDRVPGGRILWLPRP